MEKKKCSNQFGCDARVARGYACFCFAAPAPSSRPIVTYAEAAKIARSKGGSVRLAFGGGTTGAPVSFGVVYK